MIILLVWEISHVVCLLYMTTTADLDCKVVICLECLRPKALANVQDTHL